MMNFINSAIAQGDLLAQVRDLTYLPVPPKFPRRWEQGCLLRFPKELQVMLSTTVLPNGSEGHFHYVIVEVVYPDGERCFDKAFLSTLVKNVKPSGSDNFISNRGTFVDYVRQFPNWAEALEHLAGTTVKVTSVDIVRTAAPNGCIARNVRLYGLDLA